MAVLFGQRKATGKRYGQDPALLLEMERLQQQYNLAPGREAHGMQASQFAENLAFRQRESDIGRAEREEAGEQAARSGMAGAGTNVLMGAAQIRAMTMDKGAPFFGETVSGLFGGAKTVVPATVDVAAPAAAGGAAAPAAAGGAAAPSATYGAGPSAAGMAATVAAIEIARQVTAEPIEEQVGTSAKHGVGVAAEAAKGMVIGSYIMPGLGTLIGGVLGAIGGGVREATGTNWLDPVEVIGKKAGTGVICTELRRQGVMPDDIYDADVKFGSKLDYEILVGYWTWAIPTVRLMRKYNIINAIIRPIAMAWAENAAYSEGVGKPNIIGHIIHKTGVPICRFIGRQALEVAHG